MKQPRNTHIVKASGEKVPFDAARLRRSLQRAKADPKAIEEVVNTIWALVYEGMSTKEIYRKAFSLLRKTPGSSAARYKLKNAIMELGPAGFAFEKFVGEVLRNDGYKIQLNVMEQGVCVKHEVDVIAEKENVRSMIECKFHSLKGKSSDVKIPLYIQSRFKDVEATWKQMPQHEGKKMEGWVVTNTRFTTDAEQYGNCVGLTLLSWDSPKEDSLKQRIDRAGLHPLTSLTTLLKTEKVALLQQDVVLSSSLCTHPELLDKLGISKKRKAKILKEAHGLCAQTGNNHKDGKQH